MKVQDEILQKCIVMSWNLYQVMIGCLRNNFWHWLIMNLQEKQCMLHFKQYYYMLQFVFPSMCGTQCKMFKDFISQQLLMTDQGL